MANKLKIYMCSGVGATRDEYEYWLDGTTTQANTRAVNTLLARINELCVELDYLDLNEEAKIERYNKIDLLVVALQFAKRKLTDSALTRAGRLMQEAINHGKFDFNQIDDDSRGNHLDSLFAGLDSSFHSGADSEATGQFYEWWVSVIIPANRLALTESQLTRSREFFAREKGVGDAGEDLYKKRYGDIGVYLYNAADYFLYLWIPKEKVPQLPYFIRKKIKKQQEVYDYCLKVFNGLFGEEEDMQRIMRSRIIAQTGKTPEEITRYLLSERGIGVMGWDDIIMIIIIAVAATIAILQIIFSFAQEVVVAKYAEPKNIEDGCAEQEDWPGLTNDKSKLLRFGVIGLLLYLMTRK